MLTAAFPPSKQTVRVRIPLSSLCPDSFKDCVMITYSSFYTDSGSEIAIGDQQDESAIQIRTGDSITGAHLTDIELGDLIIALKVQSERRERAKQCLAAHSANG
jgi:hypothetical protein